MVCVAPGYNSPYLGKGVGGDSSHSRFVDKPSGSSFDSCRQFEQNKSDYIAQVRSDRLALRKLSSDRKAQSSSISSFVEKARSSRKEVNELSPGEEKNQKSRLLDGVSILTQSSRRFNVARDVPSSKMSLSFAQQLLDVATGVNPLTGLLRDLCGALTGVDPLSGDTLTEGGRVLSVLGLMTLGAPRFIKSLAALQGVTRRKTGILAIKGAKPFGDWSLSVFATYFKASKVNQTIYRTALKPVKGGKLSLCGHSFQKHAFRNTRWGKVSTTNHGKNEAGLNHLREIIEAKGSFKPEGIFLHKRLPDGRGVRLNTNGTFKGFIDPAKGL